MLSIVSMSRLTSLQALESIKFNISSFSTSCQHHNSGRFRKMKPVASAFLTRSPVMKSKEYVNPFFNHDYLDRIVDKLIQGKITK